jgi:hypothetical protein
MSAEVAGASGCDECGLGGVCVGAESCSCLAGWSASGEAQLPGRRAAPCNAHVALELVFGAYTVFSAGSLVVLAVLAARKRSRGAVWASPMMAISAALAGLLVASGLRRIISGAQVCEDAFLMATIGMINTVVAVGIMINAVRAALYVIDVAEIGAAVEDTYGQRLKLVCRVAVPLVTVVQVVQGAMLFSTALIGSASAKHDVLRLALFIDAFPYAALAVFFSVVLGPPIRDIRTMLREDPGGSRRTTQSDTGSAETQAPADNNDELSRRLKHALKRLTVTRIFVSCSVTFCVAQDVYYLYAGPHGFVVFPYIVATRCLAAAVSLFIQLCLSREFVLKKKKRSRVKNITHSPTQTITTGTRGTRGTRVSPASDDMHSNASPFERPVEPT